MNKKFIALSIIFFVLVLGNAFADSVGMVEIPGLGEVGYEKKDDSTYSFGIPKIGTFDFKGVFNSTSDFDLMAQVPVSAVTDYVPLVGQLLGVLGLDSVTYRITQNGLGMNIHLEEGGLGMFREYIVDQLYLFEWQRVGTEAIISSLELVSFDLDSLFDGPHLTGSVRGELSILGMKIGFHTDGTLSFEAIMNAILDEISSVATDVVAEYAEVAYEETKQVIYQVGDWGLDSANILIGEVGVIAHDVSVSVSHGRHSFDTCYNSCTVNYANSQREVLLRGSNRLFLDFYNQVYRDLISIEGSNPVETRALRDELLKNDWNQVREQLERKWQDVMNDDEVENYFFQDSSERQARDRYKGMIQESLNQHRAFRDQLYHQLMTRTVGDMSHKFPTEIAKDSGWLMNGYNQVLLVSENNRFTLVFQYDGNLVLYKDQIIPIWSSNSYNKPVEGFIFQADGNPSVYGGGQEFWSPYCPHQGGEKLVLQNDGNLVVYTQDLNPIWASGTSIPPSQVPKNTGWIRNNSDQEILRSNDGRFHLIFQPDGNLVLYKNQNEAIWHSETYNKPVEGFIFQADGNPSVYGGGQEFWSPYCYNQGGEKLVLQDDGNLVVYTNDNRAIWASNTGGR
ncbi:MAG: hypothetical protein PF447_11855 [Spirochaetaceae bacterium]|jgi:hypothetical protein|nr:hypothetical protein [Spirochaetaceae bacterium]